MSELERSAEATIIFSTCIARAPRTVAEAARVAVPAFCSMAAQSTLGALPEKNASSLAASSGLALVHLAFFAYLSATIFFNSAALFAYSSATSGKITNGLTGSPPKFLIVFT